MINIIPNEQQQ